jgi:hypothetical protein
LVLASSRRRRGRLDLPGAVTGTGGVALLVYGLWIALAAVPTAVVAIRVRREGLASPAAAAQGQPVTTSTKTVPLPPEGA